MLRTGWKLCGLAFSGSLLEQSPVSRRGMMMMLNDDGKIGCVREQAKKSREHCVCVIKHELKIPPPYAMAHPTCPTPIAMFMRRG